MNGECELDQAIWSVVGATRLYEGPFTYLSALAAQRLADKEWPKESFVVTTADAARRAIENDEQRKTAKTV